MKTKKKKLNKITSLLLVLAMSSTSLLSVGETLAYFSDVESSTENTFEAGSLDFLINNTEFDGVISNTFGDTSQFETDVSVYLGGLPLEYDLHYEKTGGSDDVCNGLNIETNRGHDEALSGFDTDKTTTLGLWSFTVTNTPLDLPVGETCEFDLVFSGLVEGETVGFSDEEIMTITITIEDTDTVVLNEFLPNPDGEQYGFDFGEDHSDMPQGEWVELYNLTSGPIDISDWYVQDASGGVGNTQITNLNTVPATTTIPANGFLVIYMNKPVWNNTGDTVKLFNGDDVLMDSYSYSSDYDYCFLPPTPGGGNTTIPSGGNNCGQNVPGNKSYARIPDGTGAFIDPIPTPGNINILDDESAALIQQAEKDTEVNTVNDTETPVITVVGNNPALITQGSEYFDLGARVTDNVNDNLGITAEGEDIDTSVLGEYEVLYTATDQAGNRGSATRLVIVYDPANGIPQIEEEEVIELSLSVQEIPLIGEIIQPEEEEVVEEEPTEEVIEEEETPIVEEEEQTEEVVEETTEEEIVEESTEEPIVEEEVVEEPQDVPEEGETPVEEVIEDEEAIKEELQDVPEEEAAEEVTEEVIEEPLEEEEIVEEQPVEEEVVEEVVPVEEEVIDEPVE